MVIYKEQKARLSFKVGPGKVSELGRDHHLTKVHKCKGDQKAPS